MKSTVRSYTQEGYHPPVETFLDDETYQKVTPLWPKACVDGVLYFIANDHPWIVLGKRKIKPHQDWWIFGGRIEATDETIPNALQRKLIQEIGLQVDLKRIAQSPSFTHHYRWHDDGSLAVATTFLVEISYHEFWHMQRSVMNSPEFSHVDNFDPQRVIHDNGLHPALRDCAQTLLDYLEE